MCLIVCKARVGTVVLVLKLEDCNNGSQPYLEAK